MNKCEWHNNRKGNSAQYHEIQNKLKQWKVNNNIEGIYVVHHRDDNDVVRAYNEAHYELWGFNEDGTFEYGKYVVFMSRSEHAAYHATGNKNFLGKHHTLETKQKMSDAQKQSYKRDPSRKEISDTARQKMSASQKQRFTDKTNHPMYGKHPTEVTKQKMSESRQGEKNSFYGKHHTEETRQRIAEKRKGKSLSEETKNRMTVTRKYLGRAWTVYKTENGVGRLSWDDFRHEWRSLVKTMTKEEACQRLLGHPIDADAVPIDSEM